MNYPINSTSLRKEKLIGEALLTVCLNFLRIVPLQLKLRDI